MSYGYFSKYDREVVIVFQIREHHAKIVKLGRYGSGRYEWLTKGAFSENFPTIGHFHIKLEVQKMQFLGLISSQNKIYCSILHLHSKHMVVFYKR